MGNKLNELYPFVYRGLLTEESLDKAGRLTQNSLDNEEVALILEKLSFEMLDNDSLVAAKRMALVYTAIHAFENMVRDFVKGVMLENHKEDWWEKVPPKINKKVITRIDEDAKFKWHGSRGGAEIEYCDFGDLSSIIIVNWDIFEIVLADREWLKSLLGILERSRNIVMHGGVLAIQDIERIGGNIRDWVRQVG
ncbi:hypothetical protein JYT95_00350 [bacterium AH-315-J23]|nr:hypothetical protein [bacterium AH-315-J23]PHQ67385.1 MAG: hypothetical protein COB92_04360 [Robiginitomaculum sp.]